MTREKQSGPSLLPAVVGARLARSNFIPKTAIPPIEWNKFCLNDYAPSAQFQNQLHEATNQAVLHRTRQLFWSCSNAFHMPSPAVSASVDRYRFAFRTTSYHNAVVAFVTMQPPHGSPGGNSPSYGRLRIYSDISETTAVATLDFNYGASPVGLGGVARGWSHARTIMLTTLALSPDTNYYAKFTDEAYGRIQAATVIETQSMTRHLDGYLPTNLTQDSEVLSLYREKVATIQKNLWKNAGPMLLSWTRADGTSPRTTSSLTATNIIDASSTAVSAATPGFTLDERNKDRVMQSSGIPCVMKAYGQMTAATAGGGTVYIKNSAGATVASIPNAWTTTASWQSVSFNLPATSDKYDLHFATHDVANAFKLYAVSIWEYEV